MMYTGDWLKDPNLGQCSLATRGAWIDILFLMHENGETGRLEGTVKGLSQICRCSESEIEDVLAELDQTKTAEIIHSSVTCNANVTPCSKNVTIINRRMAREHKDRVNTKLRVKRYREKTKLGECNEKVTSPSSSSSSYSSSNIKKNIKKKVDKFTKPTPEEVSEYAKSIDFDLEGNSFVDYYEARGWKYKQGQPMKSWQAAVRTWKGRHKETSSRDATAEEMACWDNLPKRVAE